MLSTGPNSYQSQVILFTVDKTALLYLLVNEIFAVRNLILYQLKQFQGKKSLLYPTPCYVNTKCTQQKSNIKKFLIICTSCEKVYVKNCVSQSVMLIRIS